MKKLLAVLMLMLFLISVSVFPVSAVDFEENFFLTENYIYLSGEMTVSEMRERLSSFELMSIANREGNGLNDDEFIPTGAALTLVDANIPDTPLIRTAVLLGDVDCNGKVEVSDARKALRIVIGLEGAEDYFALLACDIDCTASEMISDARSILRVSVGLDMYSAWFELRCEEFPDDHIIVIMNAKYQNPDGIYDSEFFNEDMVKSVETIFNQNDTQILVLNLKNPGIDESELLIRLLADHPAVEYACKDSYIYSD